eukprot:TRINITY_DN4157_c0_g1_i1.p1 TRINITY_DN4157_c0_g1~~TRINITY_DN4157_c0_g1_i1.p1  ORF type:complete len:4195 (-),score=848.52 TRINITY_DN4157_c0_g1_i1:38-11479(-)
MYAYGVKQSIFDYHFHDPAEQERLKGLNLPPPAPPEEQKLKGTIDIPFHDFWRERKYIEDNLFFTHHLLYQTIYAIVGRWEAFANHLLVDTELKDIELPCDLGRFKEHQHGVVDRVTGKLKLDWSVNITATIQNDLDEHFNFYEDDIERYKASRMSRFFRTINLIMSHQLRSLMLHSIGTYVAFIERFDVRQNETIDFFQAANSLSGNVPLFVIKLCGNGNSIVFSPLLEEVIEVVQGVLNNIFEYTEDITGVGDKLFPLLNLGEFYLKTIARDEAVIVKGKTTIDAILTRNMQGPRALKALYDEFEYIFKIDIESYVEDFAANQPTLQAYNDAVQKLYLDAERIKSRSLNEVSFELVKVECYEIKASLTRKANDIASALMNRLMRQTNEDITNVSTSYEDIFQQIQVEPETPEELHELKLYMDSTNSKIADLQNKFNYISDAIALLSKFGFMPNQDDFETYWMTYSWPQKVYQVLDDSEFRYKENRNRFQQELRENTQQLTEEISQLQHEIDLFSTLADESHTDEIYEKVKRMNEKIKDCKERIYLYNSREQLFGLPTTQYTNINEIVKNFEPYQQLWTIVSDYYQLFPSWTEGPFKDLDPEVVDNNVQSWTKTLHRLVKLLKDEAPGQVAASVKEKLEAFRPNIPLIYALRNPGLRDRHWKKITAVSGKTINMKDEMTFQELLAMNLQEHMADIQELSEYASKEHRLEKATEKMQNEWKSVQFELAPHADTYMLKSVDDIQQLLDDHIIKTQTMLGSPYVKAIEQQVKAWETKLLRMQSILDEWLKCQGAWHYLEPIFSSGDIQKSMAAEAHRFGQINQMWHTCMETTVKNPYVLQRAQEEKLLPSFIEANKYLEQIQKQLQQFLETKRVAFPRFYFLSNEELLEILAETKDPLRVQPYLRTCFEGISKLRFEPKTLDITAMFSGEGEEVRFTKVVNPADHANQVETWLTEVEKVMQESVRRSIGASVQDYPQQGAPGNYSREEWMLRWPGQVVLAVCQIYWTREVEEALQQQGVRGLQQYEEVLDSQMTKLVKLIRGNLQRVQRCTLEALVVIEVHSRDTVTAMIKEDVQDTSNFSWLAQLRYYWEKDNVKVRQVNAELDYGYEYLGNTGRLVITPLTDRCYRTLMGAVHLTLGGAPEGPAGTGKTETTKDLAKALAKHCVVYNCSDQISYRDMARLFKGLASSGAWACFDEFNRIEIQVLSVIAQQVATIQNAVADQRPEFLFEGMLIKLKRGCSVFITMNPGYAGRAELPDNLKALFRPVAMMVPDYAMIAEISLFSYGFVKGRSLARKIVATYKLCSEQLSTQDHYDYGMRAVKSVLTAAGRLKRKFPEEDEQILMLRGIVDVNLPKFLAQDIELFNGIVSDLFPGVSLPKTDYTDINSALTEACEHYNVQPVPTFISKTLQIYEMILVRHGVMVVGYSYAGKTMALHNLARALTTLASRELEHKTIIYTINPKSISAGQLYGQNDASMEWNDGVLSKIFRNCSHETTDDRKWIVLDGPVDAVWIENMNTVLDDNKKLCLVNGDIIHMSDPMNMVFEVQDLQNASPATVSRCGMIYMEPDALGWRPLFTSWLNTLPENVKSAEKPIALLRVLFEWLIDPALEFVKKQCKRVMNLMNDVTLVAAMLKLLRTFLVSFEEGQPIAELDEKDVQMWMEGYFLFSMVWSIGAIVDFKGRQQFDRWIHIEIGQLPEDAKDKKSKKTEEKPHKFLSQLPEKRSVYDICFKQDQSKWVDWMDTISDFKIPEGAQYHEIIVPTTDTTRYSYLLKTLILNNLPVLFVGDTGTGKSILVRDMFMHMDKEKYQPQFIQFSAQSTCTQTQAVIDSKLEKRRKGAYGPPIGKTALIFVDDLSMPEPDEYGSQPPIELLRQWMDQHGWYEHKKDNVDFKEIQDILFTCAMSTPGGGRANVTPRFIRHFSVITIAPFDDTTMRKIFGTLLDWVVTRPGWGSWARALVAQTVNATLQLFDTIQEKLLPTPEKSHYTFNLRDVSKVIQGISMAAPERILDETMLQRLWVHECYRTFADRLVNDEDRKWFDQLLSQNMQQVFKKPLELVVGKQLVLFADYMEQVVEDRQYEEITDIDSAKRAIEEYLDYYNQIYRQKMDLVVFDYVLEHVSRISRIIKQPFGNALLIGVGGSGRQSCTRLAAHIADYRLSQITLSKNYTKDAWRDDMRALLKQAGCSGQPTVFLLTDAQIKEDSFLEDISSILNSGEIPNLFPAEDYDNITEALKGPARDAGRDLNKDSLFAYFIERTRIYLHVVMCMSPIGSLLRTRLRRFPALVNCTTIDWFSAWPAQALRSVAEYFLEDVAMDQAYKSSVVDLCVYMHSSVQEISHRFFAEMRQHNYVTPTSYLELITTFKALLNRKREEVSVLKHRYDVGLEQLRRTEEEVEEMSQTLLQLKPTLLKTAKDTEELIATIEHESAEAEKTRSTVAVEEAACNAKAAASKAIRDECEAQLSEAMPALEAATRAVMEISKKELSEIRSMQQPSDKIKRVIEACCICLEEPPKRIVDPTGKVTFDYWEIAKKRVMADTEQFRDRLINYDKENIKESVIDKIQVYIKDRTFRPEQVKALSQALVGLCQWVIALDKFYRVNKVVKPKKETLAIAEKEYGEAMADLNMKKAELQAIDDRIDALQRRLADNTEKKLALEKEYDLTEKKLMRATKLMTGLGGEKTRYTEESLHLANVYSKILGDVLVSSGMIAYLGPFTSKYRAELADQWVKLCKQKGLPGSEVYDMSNFLGDKLKIQEWKMFGLPSDAFSVDNAIICSWTRRWPLLIDPQGQGNNWVKNMGRSSKLVTLRPSDSDYHKSLIQCIRYGIPVLLENVSEEIDPILEPLLLKQVFRESGVQSITIGDSTVEYNDGFRFFMTTKLPRPHFKPETSVKVTLVNFMITPLGLQDQLLQKVVQFEEKELEDRKNKFVQLGAMNKTKLKNIEDEILRLLSSGTNLLEDEEVINTLDNSKKVADEIAAKQTEIEAFEKKCDKTRTKFIPVAQRSSLLFFCITDLSNIDPMYQYSLQWYIDLFQKALRDSEPEPEHFDKRISNINEYFTYSLYKNICRSLFEKDKLLFSFIMSCKICEIDMLELRFMLTGGVDADEHLPESPASWLPEVNWRTMVRLTQQLKQTFGNFIASFSKNLKQWKVVYDSPAPQDEPFPAEWADCQPLHRLIILRVLRADKLVPAITQFVAKFMGPKFVDPPVFDLNTIFNDCNDAWVPLIFILSPGADPNAELMTFAESRGMTKKLESLSLGDGMGKRASDKILEGKSQGHWVLLQNCHLYSDWMPQLEKIIEDYSRDDSKNTINREFRLWLTAMPSEKFPVSVLQNGVKMIKEAPQGLRANLLQSFTSDPLSDPKFYTACNKPREWKKLLFGLYFFHAVVQERRSFGPLGWNIPYEFNETDLRISLRQLQEYLNKYEEIPFDALTYLTGHCNYGGRVTDDLDRRCLMAILSDYYTEEILDDTYKFTSDGVYHAPKDGSYDQSLAYIRALPMTQSPDIFGLHPNASITKDARNTNRLLDAILLTQPREGGGGGQSDTGAQVTTVAKDILSKLPSEFDLEATLKKYKISYNESMNTVLIQEMVRFNRLIGIVRQSLVDVIRAIKGEIVMSAPLEQLFNNIYDGKIPKMWLSRSYPSLKPLGGYVSDLLKRLQFFTDWFDNGPPPVFWISGFFFTQSFLTGVLQNFARKYQIEIDTLKWEFEVMSEATYAKPPADGCYVEGLFLEGASWDPAKKMLCECVPKQLFTSFPIMWLKPATELKAFPHYEAPLYKTSERRGVLSTTGHSTNFVMLVKLPIDNESKHWIKRGTALLCQLDY